MKIEFNLPNFDGFYHSLLDLSDYFDGAIGDDENTSLISNEDFDNINWNKTEANISKKYLELWIEKNSEILHLAGITNLKYKDLDRPREYNFTTDLCVCTAKINRTKLKQYIKSVCTSDGFKEYIMEVLKDKYSSYDGFISFYSNNPDIWLTEYINQLDDNCIFEGFLDFITESLTDNEQIHDVMDEPYNFIEYN